MKICDFTEVLWGNNRTQNIFLKVINNLEMAQIWRTPTDVFKVAFNETT